MTDSNPWESQSNRRDHQFMNRVIEVATVLVLAIATVGSAWCAYQVSQWNGASTDHAEDAELFSIDASREFALATQKFTYDASTAARYAEAVLADDTRMQEFLTSTLIRPEFQEVIDQWRAEVDSGGDPGSLIENQEYVDGLYQKSTDLDQQSADARLAADEAGATSEDYIVMTLFTATALFFAGVTASFRSRSTRLLLLTLSIVILGVTAARVAGLPIA